MGIFNKKIGVGEETDPKILIRELENCRKKTDFYQRTTGMLLALMSDFTLDIKELASDTFKTDLKKLSERLAQEEKLKVLEAEFSKGRNRILKYLENQKNTIVDRESELKDIIEILTRAMAEFGDDNDSFAETLNQHSSKLEKISLLEDIRQLKEKLQNEVAQFRESVTEKQSRDRRTVKQLAGKVSALNVELEKTRTESLTDGLTGAYNRKAFDEYLDRLVDGQGSRRGAFSLLMIDIDDFKKINDTYGHQTGDRILMALVEKCKQHIRSEDFCARYGGEEFAVVLPRASVRNAGKKARKLCQAIASAKYRISYGKGAMLSFTVSMGVSSRQKKDTVTTVIQRADQALYAAKKAGKNRVVTEKEL